MQARLSITFVVVILSGLAACGGGGGAGTNGQDMGHNLMRVEGHAILAPTASFQADGSASTGAGTITLDAGFLSGGGLNGSFEIFGKTVGITNGEAVIGDQSFRVIYEANRSGAYAGAIEIIAFDTVSGAIAGEAHYVFGVETDPNNLPSGSATYQGGFQVAGLLNGSDAEYEGGISFEVDFGGSVAGALDGDLHNGTNVDLALDPVPIVDNGFSGQLSCTAGCSNNAGNIDATFYGPKAEELGGVIAVGFNDYIGAGTFIIDKD